jgi:diguanylate cyclase (GGDEF)-like protein
MVCSTAPNKAPSCPRSASASDQSYARGTELEWITEVCVGLVIALLVRKVRGKHLEVLALARVDALTGLWNRRAFEAAIEDDCARARRSRLPLSLVYIDLDNFKQVNDRAGHDVGDLVLQQLAAAIRHVVRARVDRGFRLGGDEFALLLPGSGPEEAAAVVARLSEHCARLDAVWSDGALAISAGVVALEARESASDFARRADEAMYRKKRSRAGALQYRVSTALASR